MKALKTMLDLVVIVYIVLATLLLTTLLDAATFFQLANESQVLVLYQVLLAIGVALLLARLAMANMIITFKRQDMHKAQLKINELKAELYEERQAFRQSAYKTTEATPAEAQQLTYSK